MNTQPTLPAPGMDPPHSLTMIGVGNERVALMCCGQAVAEGHVKDRDELVRMAEHKGHRTVRP